MPNTYRRRHHIINREYKQITGATTAAVTKRVGRVRLGGLLILSMQSNIHGLKSLKYLLYSFSQPNGFAQRTMAIVRLARKIISEQKQMPYTLYNNNNLMKYKISETK